MNENAQSGLGLPVSILRLHPQHWHCLQYHICPRPHHVHYPHSELPKKHIAATSLYPLPTLPTQPILLKPTLPLCQAPKTHLCQIQHCLPCLQPKRFLHYPIASYSSAPYPNNNPFNPQYPNTNTNHSIPLPTLVKMTASPWHAILLLLEELEVRYLQNLPWCLCLCLCLPIFFFNLLWFIYTCFTHFTSFHLSRLIIKHVSA